MDYLLWRKCSGSSLCAYSHRLQKGIASGVLRLRTHRICIHPHLQLSQVSEPAKNPPPTVSIPASTTADLRRVRSLIQESLNFRESSSAADSPGRTDLLDSSRWPFSEGKGSRPLLVLLVASALGPVNSDAALKVAAVAEMIHTASLVHDDVIDEAEQRRGKASLSARLGPGPAILVGNRILAKATQLLASLANSELLRLFAAILEDLVRGELMQLGDRDDLDSRLSHYLQKSFKKTASLFAHACEAAAVSVGAEKERRLAFRFGRELGLAFQIVDDVLDFSATEEGLGKPVGADLRLGLSTAPVLLASRAEPALLPLMRRRFGEPGDVEEATRLVHLHNGTGLALGLAADHARAAAEAAEALPDSVYSRALRDLALAQTHRSA